MHEPHNELQDELIEEMSADISSGKILLSREADHYYFDLIYEYFPFLGSKIAWSEVPDHFHERVDYSKFSYSTRGFLERVIQAAAPAQNDLFNVLGDSILEIALTFPIGLLEKYLINIVELPQHTYIVPTDVSWCACYTMEGDMDFGRSPHSIHPFR